MAAQSGSTQASLADRIKGALNLGGTNQEVPRHGVPGSGVTGHLREGGVYHLGAEGQSSGAGATNMASTSAFSGGGGTTTRDTTTTTSDTNRVLSSSSGAAASYGSASLGDRDNLLSSDEHWAKAQAATEEARRQAKLVEAGARSHREAYDEYYKAERHAQKTKHTVEEIETRIRGINVDVKRANAHKAREQYQQLKSNLSTLDAEAQAARSQTEQIQDSVNAKGHELEHLVAASKLHSDRLVALEAHQAELRAAEQEAQDRHAAHITSIDPLKAKYAHHKAERARVAEQLAMMRAEQDALRLKEGEAQRTLDAHQGEYSALDAELAEVEESRAEKERMVMMHQQELDGVSRQHAELSALLGQHRDTVSEMTKNTQAAMADAQTKAQAADLQAAEYQKAMQGLSGQQQALDESRTALTGAVAEQQELEQGQQGAAQAVESYAQRASQLQAQLQAAKQKVDVAQAKKEELWELSKREGELADSTADVHYAEHVARPAGEDPELLTHKTDVTADIAGKTQYGQSHAIDHQASAQI